MTLFVRKIEYAKWVQRDIQNGEEASADAITQCMRTKGNNLSIWHINSEDELEEAVLAIASQFDHIDTIHILTIENSLLQDTGLNLENAVGQTPYERFAERHWDITDLTYSSLGTMADITIKAINADNSIRFRRKKLIDIIKKGIDDNKIQRDKLKPDVKKYIPS